MAASDYNPSPVEYNQWGIQRRNATQTWARNQAQGAFDLGNIQANRATDVRNLGQQYKDMRNRIPGQYASRGILGSGIYGQGLQDYGRQRTAAFGDLSRRYQAMLGQNNINNQGYAQNYTNSMSDVASAEAARRAELAAQIRGF